MTTLVVMVLLVAAYAAVSFYLRKANQYLALTDAPWDRLHAAAKKVIADDDMPHQAAVFAAAAVVCAGCGCLTRQILIDALKFGRSWKPTAPQPKLTAEQQHNFSQVVMNAIYYDSLKAPLSGFLLRRLVMPWLQLAAENRMPEPPKQRVAGLVASSKAAIEHKPAGKKVLAMACAA